MNPGSLERLKEVFHAARELPPGERDAFLVDACGSDEQLREKVDALLESDRVSADFIADPPARLFADAFGAAPEPSVAGRMIDRYRIIREIGRGGMGAVYLAERADDEYQKQVALKLIKRGMDTDSVLRHFRNERQILAGFDHPNIARLLDGGTSDDDLPYFVMEYIEGLPIDEYCNTQAVSLPARLQLFREICAAVSYAHRHLVVHRDIKRSNILVTAEGVPKLLDFGIAKILQEDGAPLLTLTGQRLMTPEYASPEQARGERVTTASDVYSLGVVLYELLAGQSPYGATTPQSSDFAKIISEVQPKKPSTVVAMAGNHRLAVNNQKFLRGDLDKIVLMALRKEPERRYQSVEQFSEDIRRHLEERPVLARKDTSGYRAAKFVRRNKTALAAAAIVLLVLIGGIVATSRQAQIAMREKARAERRFNDVRKLANSVLFDYHDAIKDLPGSTKVRERLVEDGLNYLDSLASEAHGDPALQRELAAAYERVGDVRGGKSSGSLGDIAGAIQSYTKALAIREALFALDPNSQARRDLAASHQKIGDRFVGTDKTSKGLEHLHKAQTLYLDLTRERPTDNDIQLEFADTSNKLGNALKQHGSLVAALEQFRAARQICEKLAVINPRDEKWRRALWNTYEGIADSFFLENEVANAIEENGKALSLGEALIAENPTNADYRRHLVRNYKSAGDYRKKSDKVGALEYFRRAVALEESLVAADPANALTRSDLAYLHKRIADFLANDRESTQALSHFTKARDIFEKLASDSPADLLSRILVATCHGGIAGMHAQLAEVDPALQECRIAVDLLDQIREETTNVNHRLNRAEAYEYLGYAYGALAAIPTRSGRETTPWQKSSREMFQRSLDVLEDLRRRGTLAAGNAGWASNIAAEIGKCDAALAK